MIDSARRPMESDNSRRVKSSSPSVGQSRALAQLVSLRGGRAVECGEARSARVGRRRFCLNVPIQNALACVCHFQVAKFPPSLFRKTFTNNLSTTRKVLRFNVKKLAVVSSSVQGFILRERFFFQKHFQEANAFVTACEKKHADRLQLSQILQTPSELRCQSVANRARDSLRHLGLLFPCVCVVFRAGFLSDFEKADERPKNARSQQSRVSCDH